ncbi:MAG: DUF6174 domain-containing protein [bacterium]
MPHQRICRILALVTLLLQSGCSAITQAESEFARAHLRWDTQRPAAYDYTMRLSCFCGDAVTRAVVIVVRGKVGESRTYADDGSAVPAQFNDVFPTIDGVFELIADAIDHNSARVDVTYDPVYGYPTSIALDGSTQAADDESWRALSNFHVR